jgi:hypothetical protein
MNIASPKTAGFIGLLLIVSCALALPAAAKDRWPTRRISSPATIRAESRGAPAAAAFHALCPCPDGPSRAVSARRAAIRSSRTFDWADASIGAAFAAMLGLVVALALSRRRQMHGHLTS